MAGRVQPAVEALLGLVERLFDAVDARRGQGGILSFGDERDLVLEIRHAVVDGRRRKHQHLRADSRPDYVAHQALVARHAPFLRRRIVPEVVRLVDYNEVVIAPVDRLEIDVAAHAGRAVEVGVAQDVITEAVLAEDVSLVVLQVDRPVLAQLFRTDHQHAVIAQLVVLDDRQRLEGLTEADRVGDNAAVVLLKLVNRAKDAILLELVETLPDRVVLDAGLRLDNPVLVQLAAERLEDMVENLMIKCVGILVRSHSLKPFHQGFLFYSGRIGRVPKSREPADDLVHSHLLGETRRQKRTRRGHKSQAFGREVHSTLNGHVLVAKDILSDRANGPRIADVGMCRQPSAALFRHDLLCKAIAQRPFCFISDQVKVRRTRLTNGQQQTQTVDLLQQILELLERIDGEL